MRFERVRVVARRVLIIFLGILVLMMLGCLCCFWYYTIKYGQAQIVEYSLEWLPDSYSKNLARFKVKDSQIEYYDFETNPPRVLTHYAGNLHPFYGVDGPVAIQNGNLVVAVSQREWRWMVGFMLAAVFVRACYIMLKEILVKLVHQGGGDKNG